MIGRKRAVLRRQFGAVLAICTAVASLLTLALSPTAMMPPFPLEVPVRVGSTSRVGAAMNRLTAWVYRHPARIVLGTLALSVAVLRLRPRGGAAQPAP